MVSKIVSQLGLKRGFEVGSLVSALGFVGWSQVWRTAAHGARGWWLAAGLYTAVYLFFISVMPTVANLTMKSMIVKHGLAVSDIGKGKIPQITILAQWELPNHNVYSLPAKTSSIAT